MAKILIATLYHPDAVLKSANKVGPDRLFLLIDIKPDKDQQKSLKLIQESIGRVVDVKAIKTEIYDIVAVAKKSIELIDIQPRKDKIYINITSGRKTKALGLLFAAYRRAHKISSILYFPQEDKNNAIHLPKIPFKITESQEKVINAIGDTGTDISYSHLAEDIDISRAMLYRVIEDLKNMDLITTEEGLKLTDAGKIARL